MPAEAANFELDYLLNIMRNRVGKDINVDVVRDAAGVNKITGRNQMTLRFTNALAPYDQASTYTTTVSIFNPDSTIDGNSIVLEQQSEGYSVIRGEVGIQAGTGFSNLNKPIDNGVEVLADRVALGFQLFNDRQRDPSSRGTVTNAITELKTKGGQGGKFEGVPINMAYVPKQTTPEELRMMTYEKVVRRVGNFDSREAVDDAMRIAEGHTRGPIRGTGPMSQVTGGQFYRGDEGLLFVQPGVSGSRSVDSDGNIHYDAISKKPFTKAYTMGKRDVTEMFLRSESGTYTPAEQTNIPLFRQQITKGPWDNGVGAQIKITNFLPRGGLPLPGGASTFRLPEAVRRAVGTGTLQFGFQSAKSAVIHDVSSFGGLYQADGQTPKIKISVPQLNTAIPANGELNLGSYVNEDGEEAPLTTNVGIREAIVQGITVSYPGHLAPLNERQLRRRMANDKATQEEIDQAIGVNRQKAREFTSFRKALYANSGITPEQAKNISWVAAPGDDLKITAGISQQGPFAIKHGGLKSAIGGFSFVHNPKNKASVKRYNQAFTILQKGENGHLFAPKGAVEFNQLTEGKANAASLLESIEAMTPRQLSGYLGEAYSDGAGGVSPEALAKAQGLLNRDSGMISLPTIARALGIETSERLVDDLWKRNVRMDVPLEGAEIERQNRMIKEYGVGRAKGWVAVQQFDQEGLDRWKDEQFKAMIDPRLGEAGVGGHVVKNPLGTGSLEEQRAAFEELFALNTMVGPSEKIGGKILRTVYQNKEGLVASGLLAPNQEYSGGLRSIDEQVFQYLNASQQEGLGNWLRDNQVNGNSPSLGALTRLRTLRATAEAQNNGMTAAINYGDTTYTLGSASGTNGSGATVSARQLLDALGQENGNSKTGLENLKKVWREFTNSALGEGKSTFMRGGKTGLVLPDPEDITSVDFMGLKNGENSYNGIDEVTLAHMSDRAAKMYYDALSMEVAAEAGEEIDPRRVRNVRNQLLDITEKNTSGKDLNQYEVRQGWSGRYAVNGLVPFSQMFIPDQELDRIGNVFNLGSGKGKELARKLSGRMGLWMRDPTPIVGGEDYAGAVRPMSILTSASRYGRVLQDEVNRSGFNGASMVINPLSVSEQGDADFDPFRFLPAFTLSKGDKGQIVVNAFGDKESEQADYKKTMKVAADTYDADMQEQIFKDAFSKGEASNKNPLRSPMLASMLVGLQLRQNESGNTELERLKKKYGIDVESWASEKQMNAASGVLKNYETMLPGEIAAYNKNKLELMGQHYNTYKRWTTAAFGALGIEDSRAVKAGDMSAAYYQGAIDMEGKESPLARLLNSATISKNEGTNGYRFSAKVGPGDQNGKGGFTNVDWDPTKKDDNKFKFKEFLTATASSMLTSIDDTSPEAVARYLAATSRDGTQEERTATYDANVAQITSQLTAFAAAGDMSENSRTVQARALVDKGLINENSPFFNLMRTTATTRAERIDRGSKAIEGFGKLKFHFGDQHLTGDELRAESSLTQIPFDIMRNKSDTQRTPQGYWDTGHKIAGFMQPHQLQETLLKARERGVLNHPLMGAIIKMASGFGITSEGGTATIDGVQTAFTTSAEFAKLTETQREAYNKQAWNDQQTIMTQDVLAAARTFKDPATAITTYKDGVPIKEHGKSEDGSGGSGNRGNGNNGTTTGAGFSGSEEDFNRMLGPLFQGLGKTVGDIISEKKFNVQFIGNDKKKLTEGSRRLKARELINELGHFDEDVDYMENEAPKVIEELTGRPGGTMADLVEWAGGSTKNMKATLKRAPELVKRIVRMGQGVKNAQLFEQFPEAMAPAISEAAIATGQTPSEVVRKAAIMAGNPVEIAGATDVEKAADAKKASHFQDNLALMQNKYVSETMLAASTPASKDDIKYMEEAHKQLSAVAKATKDYGEALKGTSTEMVETTKKELRLSKVRQEQSEITEKMARFAEKVGIEKRDRDGNINIEGSAKAVDKWVKTAPKEAKAAALRGEADLDRSNENVAEGARLIEQRNSLDASQAEAEYAAGQEKAANSGIGGLARRMFGGFGIMYMKSVGNLMLSPASIGYSESIKQREQIDASLGAAMGGIAYSENPEQQYDRAIAAYGGGGMRALKSFQANFAKNTPTGYKLANSALSGVAAFGAGSWILPSALPALGAAAITPIAVGIGAAVAGGAYALSQYGEYTDEEGATARLAVDLGRSGNGSGSENFTFSTASLLKRGKENPNVDDSGNWFYGAAGHLLSQDRVASNAVAANRILYGAGIDNTLIGLTNERKAEIAKAAAGGLASQNPNIPVEAIAQANSLMFSTGTNFGSQFSTIATMIGQGVPIVDLAGTMLQNMGMSSYAIHSNTGSGSAYGNTILGLSTANLDQASVNIISSGEKLRESFGANVNYWNELKSPNKDDLQAQIKERLDKDLRYGALNAPQQELIRAEELRAAQAAQLGIKYEKKDYLSQWVTKTKGAGGGYTQLDGTKVAATPDEYKATDIGPREFAMDQYESARMDMYVGRMQQYQTSLASMGITGNAMSTYLDKFKGPQDMGALELAIQRTSIADQYGTYASYAGLPANKVLANKGKILNMGTRDMQLLQGVMSLDPKSIAMSFAGGASRFGNEVDIMAPMLENKSGGMSSIYDMSFGAGFDQSGTQMTGLDWGKGSFARMGRSAQDVAVDIWGKNWNTGAAKGYLNAGVNGFERNGKTYYGEYAMGFYHNQRQYEFAMASAGNQMANWNLQYAFTTGVGISAYSGTINPQTGSTFGFNTGNWSWNVNGVGSGSSVGGGTWGLEDVQRQMGNAQQEWNFGQQQRQMTMQNNQFYENLSLNRTQSMMQRGWTQDDWAYQDQTRTMQWDWKQEDFNEEVRFMSGRQRKLAERSMKRETISHNMEGDQIDKTRDRQKELWELEDQRFTVQKRQHEEQLQMQREQLEVQRNMFEERKRLEEEQVKMQRAMWVNQMELQRQAIGISAAAAAEQKDYNDRMLEYQIYQEQAKTKLDLFIEALAKLLELDLSPLWGSGSGGGDGSVRPTAFGGSIVKGQRYLINENPSTSPERFVASTSGYMLTKQDAQKALAEQMAREESSTIVPQADQWQNSILSNVRENRQVSQGQTVIIVKIGEETIKNYIVETVNNEVRL